MNEVEHILASRVLELEEETSDLRHIVVEAQVGIRRLVEEVTSVRKRAQKAEMALAKKLVEETRNFTIEVHV